MFIVGIVLFVLTLVVVVMWIVFPVIVRSYLRYLLGEARKQTSLLEEIARNTRPPGSPEKPASSVKYRTPGN